MTDTITTSCRVVLRAITREQAMQVDRAVGHVLESADFGAVTITIAGGAVTDIAKTMHEPPAAASAEMEGEF